MVFKKTDRTKRKRSQAAPRGYEKSQAWKTLKTPKIISSNYLLGNVVMLSGVHYAY